MDAEGFGMWPNVTACEVECPKEILQTNIARAWSNGCTCRLRLVVLCLGSPDWHLTFQDNPGVLGILTSKAMATGKTSPGH